MSDPHPRRRSQDPLAAVGRIGGGVILYGAIGYLLDRWWDTFFMVGIGAALGASLGTYVVIASLRHSDN